MSLTKGFTDLRATTPLYMNVVEMNGFGPTDTLSWNQKPIPSPQGNEVRIRIKAAGFNPVDTKIRRGWYGGDFHKILGFDCSGVVDFVGPDVQHYRIGDEVYAMPIKGSNGCYAQYVCVPEELVGTKPKNLSFSEAASVPLAAMTAFRATVASRAFAKGDCVFVAGLAGGVGCFALQFLKQLGITKIFTIAKDQKSAEFLQNQMGIPQDHILIYGDLPHESLKEKLIAMNQGKLFDATLDLIGGERKRLCLELTKISGHFSTILPEDNFNDPFWNETALPRARNLSVHQVNIGAELGSADSKDAKIYALHLKIISEMFEKGYLTPPHTTVFNGLSVRNVKEAHEMLEKGRTKGKVVMEIE